VCVNTLSFSERFQTESVFTLLDVMGFPGRVVKQVCDKRL